MKNYSSIRSLINRAEEGSVPSSFQLYKNYLVGKRVDKDIEKAEHYAARAISSLGVGGFRVKSLTLKNYKGFSSFSVDFGGFNPKAEDQNVTIFTGVNGVGKSAALEAVSMAFSWLVRRILNPKSTGIYIDEKDIHVDGDGVAGHASIYLEYKIGSGDLIGLELNGTSEGAIAEVSNDVAESSLLAEAYRLMCNRDLKSSLPLIALYGVERGQDVISIEDKDKDKDDFMSELQSRKDGLRRSLNGSANFKLFFEWIKSNQDIVNSEKKSEFERLEKEIASLNTSLALSNLAGEELVAKALSDSKEEKQIKLDKLKKILSSVPSECERAITLVAKAISNFMPNISNLRVVYTPEIDLLVDKYGTPLSVRQLSQGERSTLALIADITRRLLLLNPGLPNPLEGYGVVLIDEIDLHLHPGWQQKIVPGLRSVFPNIQFILSTHSPQVIQSVQRESVRMIGVDASGLGIARFPSGYTYGGSNADVLEVVMDVCHIPPIPETNDLEKLFELVTQVSLEELDSVEVRDRLKRLEGTLGEEHSSLVSIRRTIKRRKVLSK